MPGPRRFALFSWTCALAFALFAAGGFAREGEEETAPELGVPLHGKLGEVGMAVSGASELGQQYFDQGLRLTYAFWMSEARRSFDEAARLDDSPMAHWGRALAYGPYLNNGAPPEDQLETAWEAIRRARELSASATPKEQAMIEALSARYAEDPAAERAPARPRLLRKGARPRGGLPGRCGPPGPRRRRLDEHHPLELLGR